MGLLSTSLGVEADKLVLITFAALHDTQRFDEDSDPMHGVRACRVAGEMRADGFLNYLDDGQYYDLCEALYEHNGSPGHSRVNVGAALDADRYTLWRVGSRPKMQYLSAAREGWLSKVKVERLITAGRRLTRRWPGGDWESILELAGI